MTDERHVYGLYDPRQPDVVMYAGITKRGAQTRLQGHIKTAREGGTYPVSVWIRSLLKIGLEPKVKLLVDDKTPLWSCVETFFIKHWRALNPGLLNLTDGGEPGGRRAGDGWLKRHDAIRLDFAEVLRTYKRSGTGDFSTGSGETVRYALDWIRRQERPKKGR